MNPIICSCGALGQAIVDVCKERNATYYIFDQRMPDYFDVDKPDIGIFCGKKNQEKFETFVAFCEKKELPLINASTDMKVPEGMNMAIINAPNLSIPMMAFMAAYPVFVRAMTRAQMLLDVVESHQSTKTSASGTAMAILRELDMVHQVPVEMVRLPAYQLALGVPQEFLGGHAYHYFTLRGQGVKIQTSTHVHGRRTYGEGAFVLAQAILGGDKLKPGVYKAADILFDPNFV